MGRAEEDNDLMSEKNIWKAGIFGVLVLSGETTLDVADKAPRQPDLIAENISVLGELLARSRK